MLDGNHATVDIDWLCSKLQEKNLLVCPQCQSPCFLTPSNTRHSAIIKATCSKASKKFAVLSDKGKRLLSERKISQATVHEAQNITLAKEGGCQWQEILLTSKRVNFDKACQDGALVSPGEKDKFGSPKCLLEADFAVLVSSLLSFDSYKQYKGRSTSICIENRPFPKNVFYQIRQTLRRNEGPGTF